MNLKEFFADDNAVSPVIGVILMVAITVILAAVIGTFVLNLGDNLQSTSPTASFSFEEGDDFGDGDTSDLEVKITHDGGDTIPKGNLKVTVNGNTAYTHDSNDDIAWESGEDVSAGTTVTLERHSGDGGPEFSSGDTVRVVWTSADGSNSQTLDSYTIQDN